MQLGAGASPSHAAPSYRGSLRGRKGEETGGLGGGEGRATGVSGERDLTFLLSAHQSLENRTYTYTEGVLHLMVPF